MTNLIAQITKDLPQAVQATEADVKITNDLGDLVFFTVREQAYTANITKTGKVKKNSTRPYDSYR